VREHLKTIDKNVTELSIYISGARTEWKARWRNCRPIAMKVVDHFNTISPCYIQGFFLMDRIANQVIRQFIKSQYYYLNRSQSTKFPHTLRRQKPNRTEGVKLTSNSSIFSFWTRHLTPDIYLELIEKCGHYQCMKMNSNHLERLLTISSW
jgi:hypothetical protein